VSAPEADDVLAHPQMMSGRKGAEQEVVSFVMDTFERHC
jgi:hypothetical protein